MEGKVKGFPDPDITDVEWDEIWPRSINLEFEYEGVLYYLCMDEIPGGVYLASEYEKKCWKAHRFAEFGTEEEFERLIVFGKPIKQIIDESYNVRIVM